MDDQTYGFTTYISIEHMQKMFPMVCQQIETDFPIRAYQSGFGLISHIKHRKEIALDFDQETGEPYEICVVSSYAKVRKLSDHNYG